MKHDTIYLILLADGRRKIGCTQDLPMRLHALRSQHGPVSLERTWGRPLEDAHRIEQRAHAIMAANYGLHPVCGREVYDADAATCIDAVEKAIAAKYPGKRPPKPKLVKGPPKAEVARVRRETNMERSEREREAMNERLRQSIREVEAEAALDGGAALAAANAKLEAYIREQRARLDDL